VPDTLDLAERAKLAIHGLTSLAEPQKDYAIYWLVNFAADPPYMKLDARLTVKFMEDLPLLRIMTGSDLNRQVDRAWMESILHMAGPDGLIYSPSEDKKSGGQDDPSGRFDYVQWPHVRRTDRLLSPRSQSHLARGCRGHESAIVAIAYRQRGLWLFSQS